MGESDSFHSEEKAKWELEKLKAEVQHLSRPWLRNPASWVALATTLIALVGASFQLYRSDIDYKLAEIKRERTALETKNLDRLRVRYSEEARRAQAKLDQLLRQASIASASLSRAEERLKVLEKQLPATPESRAAVEQAKQSLNSLRAANSEISAQTERTSDSLGGLIQQLKEPEGESSVYDVSAWEGEWSTRLQGRKGPVLGRLWIMLDGEGVARGTFTVKSGIGAPGELHGYLNTTRSEMKGFWKNKSGQEGRFVFNLSHGGREFVGLFSMNSSEPTNRSNTWEGRRSHT